MSFCRCRSMFGGWNCQPRIARLKKPSVRVSEKAFQLAALFPGLWTHTTLPHTHAAAHTRTHTHTHAPTHTHTHTRLLSHLTLLQPFSLSSRLLPAIIQPYRIKTHHWALCPQHPWTSVPTSILPPLHPCPMSSPGSS